MNVTDTTLAMLMQASFDKNKKTTWTWRMDGQTADGHHIGYANASIIWQKQNTYDQKQHLAGYCCGR